MKMRYSAFDGLRGLFLVLMMYGHTTIVLQSGIGKILNHHRLGFADAANGFVFLSGLVIAIYFTRVAREKGERALAPLVRRRVLLIYKYHLGALLGLATLAGIIPSNSSFLGQLSHMGAEGYLALALLIHQPIFFDILPMYMVFIAITPLLLRLMKRGNFAQVLITSIGFWLIAQTGLISYGLQAVEWKIEAAGYQIEFGSFNILAWQLIYVSGLIIGYLTATGRFNVAIVRSLPKVAVACIALLFVGLAVFQNFLILYPTAFKPALESFVASHSKANFTIFFIASCLAYGLLLVWLYVAGPFSTNRFVAVTSQWLRNLLNSRPLTMLGRNSIQVFSYHLVVVYLLSPLTDRLDLDEGLRYLIAILATLSLFAFAEIWTRSQQFRQAERRQKVVTRPE
jgi:hypothetical protein